MGSEEEMKGRETGERDKRDTVKDKRENGSESGKEKKIDRPIELSGFRHRHRKKRKEIERQRQTDR